MKLKKKLVWAGSVLFLLLLLSASLFPAGGTPQKKRAMALRLHSASRLKTLGSDIERYITETGRRPERLNDIANSHSDPIGKASYFMIPGSRQNDAEARFSASTNEFRYEDYSDYVLDTNQASEILIYEKPGIRNDNTVYYYKKGFGVWKLKRTEFEERLKSGNFPPPWK